ncbi:MAG: hypothetical protein U5K27_04660 [Desulfotignum sp.]|nr:hypothetical protein [Desulfotignum sp.]
MFFVITLIGGALFNIGKVWGRQGLESFFYFYWNFCVSRIHNIGACYLVIWFIYLMKKFKIESDIEKMPNILGLKASFFFIFVAGLLITAIPLVKVFSLTSTILALVFNAGLYFYLFWRSGQFSQNKNSDDKMPEYIDNNP